ncbi:hypothetical protein JCM10450v2_002335 [Rhodotorula kratochvilovae]
MATVIAIPISPLDDRHTPVLSTLDPSFSPSSLHLQPYTSSALPIGLASPSLSSPSSSPSPTPSPVGSVPETGFAVPMGSRCEKVPYDGPGTAIYVRQPTRSQLRDNNSLFGSASRPYYYQDPQNKPFIDIDGKQCGVRWIYVDPKARAREDSPSDSGARDDKVGCCIM